MNIRVGFVAIWFTKGLLACTVYDPSLLTHSNDGVTGADDNPQTGGGVDAAPGPTGAGGASSTGPGSSGSSATTGVTVTVGTTGSAGRGGAGSTVAGGAGGATISGTGGAPSEIDAGSGGVGGGALDAGVPSMDAGTPPPTPDAGCARCPVGIALGSELGTPLEGGPSGTVHLDKCPGAQVVIGYQGYTETASGPTVGRLQTVCGQVAIISTSTGYRATIAPGAVLPMRGTHGQDAWTNEMCPQNQVVVGVHGMQQGAGDAVNQLAFDCAPLTVSASGSSYEISIGRPTTLPANGGPGGTAFNDGCGSGRVARGSEIHATNWVDAFALFCAIPVPVGSDGLPL